LPKYLARNEVIAIDGIDTRKLTRHIRDEGNVGAVVTTEEMSADELIAAAKAASLEPALTEAEAVARDLGAKLTKLPLGHHASNIPVKDLRDGKLYITRQHHGYQIDFDGVEGVEVTHLNLNDQTVEGFAVPAKGIELTLFDSLELRDLLTTDQIQKEG
jgi:carbamoylphosphate synthase small subunit